MGQLDIIDTVVLEVAGGRVNVQQVSLRLENTFDALHQPRGADRHYYLKVNVPPRPVFFDWLNELESVKDGRLLYLAPGDKIRREVTLTGMAINKCEQTLEHAGSTERMELEFRIRSCRYLSHPSP